MRRRRERYERGWRGERFRKVREMYKGVRIIEEYIKRTGKGKKNKGERFKKEDR